MEPDTQAPPEDTSSNASPGAFLPDGHPPVREPAGTALVRAIFIGPQRLRAGWAALLFLLISFLFILLTAPVLGLLLGMVRHGHATTLTPQTAFLSEVIQLLAIVVAGLVMARIEGRNLQDYYFGGPRRLPHFLGGLAAGFTALSALVAALAAGGWLHFGPASLSGPQLLGYALIWAAVFLLTGLFEEGSFRCYLQYTFTRGINFWWALAAVAVICAAVALRSPGEAAWGVYIVAALGLPPCLWLHAQRAAHANFWQAAWVTSTLFGFVHTGNHGENWIGIFGAAAIGFVFCVSIWVTGSVWWAVGCHAAWDWAETFFYGTADSGLTPKGHFLATTPAGNVFWSGGSDGPEGSILILGVLVLLTLALLLIYGRRRALSTPAEAPQHLTS